LIEQTFSIDRLNLRGPDHQVLKCKPI